MLVVGTPGFQDGVQIPAASLLAVVPVLVMGVGSGVGAGKDAVDKAAGGDEVFCQLVHSPHGHQSQGWNWELHPGCPHAWAIFCFPKCIRGQLDGK